MRTLRLDSPVGVIGLVAYDRGLRRVLLPGEHVEKTLKRFAAAGELSDDDESDAARVLRAAAEQITEYFDGDRTEFDLRLHLVGNPFELDVWNAMRTIPYGETISYAEQAERAGHPGAYQAVGAANGRNPVPIVIPCHRVIGSDGSLVGFGGGLACKRRLLDLEAGIQHLF